MRTYQIMFLALALAVLLVTPSSAQEHTLEPEAIQQIRLNVFLGQWQVLGPLPHEVSGAATLDHQYFDDEANFRGGNVRFHRDRLYTWKSVNSRLVDLRSSLATGNAGDNCTGYAWTQFVSDRDQKLRLAIAHDDMCAAWLNGDLVCRSTQTMPSALDQATYDVDVKKGVNSLLLKVTNGTKEWDFAVRFLPTDVQIPLVEFKCMPDVSRPDFPVVGIDILDKSGKSLARHLCSGTRISWYTPGTFYRLYAKPPAGDPHTVHFVAKQAGFEDFSQKFPWEEVVGGTVTLEFQADRPVQLVVTDATNGKPVKGAVVWDQKKPRSAVTDSNGAVSVRDFQPTVPECWVSAPGYLAKRVKLDWPRRNVHKVLMSPGGCTLVGQVTSDSGKAVPNATVKTKASSYPAFQPEFQTDQNGRFRVHGFFPDKPVLSATVSARGHVTSKGIGFSVSTSKPTDVNWTLESGVLVTGKVTHAKTGKPISGIEVLGGESRYESNKITSTTDKNGMFELVASQPGTLTVTTLSDRHSPAMQSVTTRKGIETKVNLQVDEGVTYRGVVKDQKGQPVGNARIVVNRWAGKRTFSRNVRSNAQGEFILPHMPDRDVEAYAYLEGYLTSPSLPLTENELVAVTLKTEVNYTYRIKGNGEILPNVSIARGYKFSGQTMYSWQSSGSSVSRMYNASTGELTVTANNSTSYATAYRLVSNGFEEKIVEIPQDANASETFDVNLEPARLFRGIVVDPDTGLPRPGIAVTLVSQSDLLNISEYTAQTVWQQMTGTRYSGAYAITDSKGEFQLTAPPENRTVEFVLASQDGGFHHVGNLPTDTFASTRTPVTLPYPEPASIQGVHKIGGKPIANQRIRFAWTNTSGDDANGRKLFAVAMQATTDADGKFQTVIAAGRYQVSRVMSFQGVDSIGHNSYVGSDRVVLLPGENKQWDLEVPEGFSVSGVARDPSGNPLPFVFIEASGSEGTEGASMSDGEGRFKLEHLSAGTIQLSSQRYERDDNGTYNVKYQGNHSLKLFESIQGYELNLSERNNPSVSVYQPTQSLSVVRTVAPHFEVSTINPAAKYNSDQLLGKVVVVFPWQSQSQDLATVQKVYDQYRDYPDVVFFAVNTGTSIQELRASISRQGVKFPVVFYDQFDHQGQLPFLLNIQNYEGCVVIGRDGKFAAEVIPSTLLTPVIQTALGQSAPSKDMYRLQVQASAGTNAMDVAGAKLSMIAYDSAGKVIAQDKYSSRLLKELTWRYPAVGAGGKLVVMLSGNEIESQTKTIENPAANEQLLLKIAAPRKLGGRITDQDNKPVQGMRVRIYSQTAGTTMTTTDANGDYEVNCFPGQYFLLPQSNESYAVSVENGQGVTSTKDLRPINFKASPAITIRGRVLNVSGDPVSSGTVMIGSTTRVRVDKDGKYALPGTPSIGASTVVAMENEQYGMIQISDPSEDETYDIQIGKGYGGDSELVTVSDVAAPMDLRSLTGDEVHWEPNGVESRCLLFCSLWHPRTSELLQAAESEAQRQNAKLQIISLDFTLEQAVREAERLKLTNVLFAGPQGLTLPDEWRMTKDHLFVVVTANGKISSRPQLVKE